MRFNMALFNAQNRWHALLIVMFTGTFSAAQTSASELLGQVDIFLAGGSDPCSAAPIEFYMVHSESLDTWVNPISIGQSTQYWPNGSSGSIEFNSSNSAQFGSMANALTDGLNGYLFLLAQIQGCQTGGGTAFSESESLKGNPDLFGNTLDYVRLIVSEPSINQEGTGTMWQANISYEFWGTPTPEPASIVLLGTTLIFIPRRPYRRISL